MAGTYAIVHLFNFPSIKLRPDKCNTYTVAIIQRRLPCFQHSHEFAENKNSSSARRNTWVILPHKPMSCVIRFSRNLIQSVLIQKAETCSKVCQSFKIKWNFNNFNVIFGTKLQNLNSNRIQSLLSQIILEITIQ